jgi:hypothetical protein
MKVKVVKGRQESSVQDALRRDTLRQIAQHKFIMLFVTKKTMSISDAR